jgi:hypothetical protein
MADGNTLLALTLGLGGGLALAYMRRAEDTSTIAAGAKLEAPAQKPASAKACSLRLDARGLTADGQRVDVAGAVARCKATGRAELIFAKDGPAAIYVDLNRALSRAGIAVRVSGG